MKKIGGFDYYLEEEVIKEYQRKPITLRLKWLYQANILRKYLPKRIIQIQDKFRQGKI
ncbi:MAG: hypothetical protein NC900_00930 [Candidatus Omnitrophica bacterium]|nr:hypothetical protein [Candidatus Omnitrophota bacterium]